MAFLKYSIALKTPPASEPISLQEAKDHLGGIESTDRDGMIQSLITSARQQVEIDSGDSLMSQTLQLFADAFPAWEIELPRGPVQSIVSIKYYDSTGTLQTITGTDYMLDNASFPARLTPAPGKSWPGAQDRVNAIVVEYLAGYTGEALVPERRKQAIKLLLFNWYDNPGAIVYGVSINELPQGYKALLSDHHRGL